MINFFNLSYLKLGNPKQQTAYQVLTRNSVLEKLAEFTPILVGTIPINIDIESSDLDIICYVQDKEKFKYSLLNYFHHEKGFTISENQTFDAVKANFCIEDFEIEIFGQNIPTTEQNAYRHMVIEHQLLLENGEDFRLKIIDLKMQGYKTEPAFAKLLGLTGNAYEVLLNLW
ncbi:uncharacterized protein DUF4269 [Pedobacter psychrotolerans]|uniref:Alpha/beta hydrolase n=1 Tax=Pedobacter psychrotolerans TaxID=1843235 RepID=A0A4R2H9J5_9SPHI|nr:DUF4269 domain-containing protein [Pedobacter psychrotolerans]TCO23658.1 uncharacterized protein DUF4269 [Pedobacter psychrotolerans]GGE61620.1 alpha/beta hydrolase [Pedobacter psychrotolerans]